MRVRWAYSGWGHRMHAVRYDTSVPLRYQQVTLCRRSADYFPQRRRDAGVPVHACRVCLAMLNRLTKSVQTEDCEK